MSEYLRLDLSQLNFSDEIISYEEALEDVTPLKIAEEIIFGQKKLNITKAEKDSKRKCVKLEISC